MISTNHIQFFNISLQLFETYLQQFSILYSEKRYRRSVLRMSNVSPSLASIAPAQTSSADESVYKHGDQVYTKSAQRQLRPPAFNAFAIRQKYGDKSGIASLKCWIDRYESLVNTERTLTMVSVVKIETNRFRRESDEASNQKDIMRLTVCQG